MSPYFMNNYGEELCRIIIIFIISYVILLVAYIINFNDREPQTNKKPIFFTKIFKFIMNTFVYNFAIIYYLSEI